MGNYAGAAIQAGGGLLGSIFGGIFARRANRETNQANERMHAQDIAAQYNMQDKAQQYTLENMAAENEEWTRRFGQENDEWQRRYDLQNAYNTPAAQRERLEAAGLNPYLMMTGGSAGVSSAALGTSSSSPAAHQGAQGSVPNPIPNISSAPAISSMSQGILDSLALFSTAALQLSGSRKNASETTGIDIDNATRMRENLAKIANLVADTQGKKLSNNYQKMANDVMGQTLDTQVEQAKQNYQLTVQQTFLAQQQGLKIQMDMEYLPQQYQAQIDWLAQQVAESKVRQVVHETQAALNKSNITRNEVENALNRKLIGYYDKAGMNQAADADKGLGDIEV